MKVVKLALIIALFSAALGAINAFEAASGETWFPNVNYDLPDTKWDEVAAGIEEQNGGIFDSVYSILSYGYLIGSILWGAFKGVIHIGGILEQVFYFDAGGFNAAEPICNVIQILVYIVYVVGFYQLRHGDSIKHYW